MGIQHCVQIFDEIRFIKHHAVLFSAELQELTTFLAVPYVARCKLIGFVIFIRSLALLKYSAVVFFHCVEADYHPRNDTCDKLCRADDDKDTVLC